MADQAGRLAYAHGSVFTTEPLEAYAADVGRRPAGRRPGDLPGLGRIGGDRDRAQARPRLPPRTRRTRARTIVVARHGSYHGNTLGALDLSGRPPLRRPYEPWLGPVPTRLGGLSVPGGPARRARAGRHRGTGGRARAHHRRRWARDASRRSSRSRSSGRRSPPPSRRTATGRRSPRSAAVTASCSSPTR